MNMLQIQKSDWCQTMWLGQENAKLVNKPSPITTTYGPLSTFCAPMQQPAGAFVQQRAKR